MANLLTSRKYLVPDAISHNSGIITATFNGVSYNLTLPALTANTLYFLYLGTLSSVTGISQSTAVPSAYLASNPGSILIGAYYANGGPAALTGSTAATAIAFGSFVNIEGTPKSEWIPYNMVLGAVTTPPTKATNRVNDDARWMRIGDQCWMSYEYHHNNNAGAAIGSGIYLYPIPANIGTLDTSKFAVGQDLNARTAISWCATTTSATGLGWTKFHDNSNIRLTSTNNNATVNAPADWSSAFFSYASASYGLAFMLNFPTTLFTNTALKDL